MVTRVSEIHVVRNWFEVLREAGGGEKTFPRPGANRTK